ncbi:Type IV leader peptidase family protein [Gemmata obscuriglobus]|uniref:Prepilin peptidase n=1 Tax=Gemmata obscuriglobus TaxID=114 RepID=A0A2Z3H599_9BACT|nr:A24 family peptidase [Gemmata obscuriglobus]AWM36784.1 prepilin peptidase [Gemmata obscuriglobus]QEG30556.1 Type IV leader peptidase family protein [Gemmata obscuriglobus]VTS09880.1 peptidase a24a prepilin type iv : Type IV prepilin peptidase CpaA-like protein OS=Blastopirellula marina DSM 3645 GN=DSM3645_06439 PE=4 SV=1: Peptidase_A24 [Gemmata obscuriglobus UQM 2246]
MSNAAPVLPTPVTAADDSLGIDRAFVLQMAKMPLLALAWLAAAVAAHFLWAAVWPEGLNGGPLVVICVGMVLAAVIDGWALKVPNWLTMPLVLSGWMLGGLHDLGVPVDAGTGGLALAVLGTVFGFALLLPMLAIGGVGAGDVKMQMGFGAWVGAFFGTGGTTAVTGTPLHGMSVVFGAFCFGAVVGGAFGLIIILIRRQFKQNAGIVREIMSDLHMFGTGQVSAASKRAHDRRSRWTKLPYGIPLCVGFLLYLGYKLLLVG